MRPGATAATTPGRGRRSPRPRQPATCVHGALSGGSGVPVLPGGPACQTHGDPAYLRQERIIEFTAANLMAIGRDLTPAAAVVPSMVLVADPSAYVPEAEAGRLTARGFEVRRVPGAGHSVWYGFFDQFMAALDGWI